MLGVRSVTVACSRPDFYTALQGFGDSVVHLTAYQMLRQDGTELDAQWRLARPPELFTCFASLQRLDWDFEHVQLNAWAKVDLIPNLTTLSVCRAHQSFLNMLAAWR